MFGYSLDYDNSLWNEKVKTFYLIHVEDDKGSTKVYGKIGTVQLIEGLARVLNEYGEKGYKVTGYTGDGKIILVRSRWFSYKELLIHCTLNGDGTGIAWYSQAAHDYPHIPTFMGV